MITKNINFVILYMFYLYLSIFIITNPFIIKYFYFDLDKNKKLNDVRINTVKYIWYINDLSNKFNSKETSHLIDVKNLYFKNLLIFFIFSIWWKKIYISNNLYLNKSIKVFMIIFFFIITLLIKYNFRKFWYIFHKPFFKDDTWLFNSNSLIIRCFPLKFWTKIVTYILNLFIILLIFDFIKKI